MVFLFAPFRKLLFIRYRFKVKFGVKSYVDCTNYAISRVELFLKRY